MTLVDSYVKNTYFLFWLPVLIGNDFLEKAVVILVLCRVGIRCHVVRAWIL